MLLVMTDDLARTNRLIRDLDAVEQMQLWDFYKDMQLSHKPRTILVDVAHLDSAAVSRLRSTLNEIRGPEVPLLLITLANTARAEALARVIGASETFSGTVPPSQGWERAVQIYYQEGASPRTQARRLAAEARQFLVEAFFSGDAITPAVATTGSDLIARAVRESGIRHWVFAVQRFDNATHQHCLLVAGLAAAFATNLGLGALESYRLTKAALLHDVGKTQIPLSILNKPSFLTPAEMTVMRTHALKGYDMLKYGDFPQETLAVVRSHHELLDGSGYPDGLKEDDIPDLVRLTTICDIFGALIERRVYKDPMPAEKAYGILERMTGRLDMDLVRVFKPLATAIA